MEKFKEYKIDSFDKLVDIVNSENVENLCSDLCGWLTFTERMISSFRLSNPELTKDKKNSEIVKCWFNWVDDGKTDFLGVNIENSDTGEIKEIRF